jgi:hypothetical protein
MGLKFAPAQPGFLRGLCLQSQQLEATRNNTLQDSLAEWDIPEAAQWNANSTLNTPPLTAPSTTEIRLPLKNLSVTPSHDSATLLQ